MLRSFCRHTTLHHRSLAARETTPTSQCLELASKARRCEQLLERPRDLNAPPPTCSKNDRNLTTGQPPTQTNASDAPFEDSREVMEDCGMGRRVQNLKKEPTPEATEKEGKHAKGLRDARCRKSDAMPAPLRLAAMSRRGERGERESNSRR
jgi:hypothetical protein